MCVRNVSGSSGSSYNIHSTVNVTNYEHIELTSSGDSTALSASDGVGLGLTINHTARHFFKLIVFIDIHKPQINIIPIVMIKLSLECSEIYHPNRLSFFNIFSEIENRNDMHEYTI